MPDDRKKTGAADRTKISLDQPHEVAYWTKQLGVTKDQLKRAVVAAGHTVKGVRAWLDANS